MLRFGFDVGGTNIAAGIVNERAEIIARKSIRFPVGESYLHISGIMAHMVNELCEEVKITPAALGSVGVAVPGSIDRTGSIVLHAHNLQFHNVPFRDAMQAHFKSVPVYLANDADAAALAELHAGAFVGVRTAVLITLGTGYGGGIILDQKLFRGGLGNGIELGHAILLHGGRRCPCGVNGCTEALCAAPWLSEQGRLVVNRYPASLLHEHTGGDTAKVTPKLVIDCAKAGDAVASEIFSAYVDQLGSAVVSLVHILDPEIIAVGGGISHAGDFLFTPLRENVKKKCYFDDWQGRIVPAVMGNDAGIVGAAMLS